MMITADHGSAVMQEIRGERIRQVRWGVAVLAIALGTGTVAVDVKPDAHILPRGGPMRRDQAISILRTLWPQLQQLGVTRLSLFGSVARDEAGPNSDVDVLVDLPGPNRFDRRLAVQDLLQSALGGRVDVATFAGLKPRAAEVIAREALRVA